MSESSERIIMHKLNGVAVGYENIPVGYYVSKSQDGELLPLEIFLDGDVKCFRFINCAEVYKMSTTSVNMYSLKTILPAERKPDPAVNAQSEIVKIEYIVDCDRHEPAVRFPKGPFSDPMLAMEEYKKLVASISNECASTITLEKLTTTRQVLRKSR